MSLLRGCISDSCMYLPSRIGLVNLPPFVVCREQTCIWPVLELRTEWVPGSQVGVFLIPDVPCIPVTALRSFEAG